MEFCNCIYYTTHKSHASLQIKLQFKFILKYQQRRYTCSSLRFPKAMPPDIRTVAVSGTRNTFLKYNIRPVIQYSV